MDYNLFLAEYVGVTFLTFFITLSALKLKKTKYIAIALTIAIAIILAKKLGGYGHINSAATVMFTIVKDLNPLTSLLVIISHSLGGITGGFLISKVIKDRDTIFPRLNCFKKDAFYEYIGVTIFLYFIYLTVMKYYSWLTPYLIGAIIPVLIMVFKSQSHIGFNPGNGLYRQIGFNYQLVTYKHLIVRFLIPLFAGFILGIIIVTI